MPDHDQFPPAALWISGLTKAYAGGFVAMRDLDLEIRDGAFFGLLGPNGAGKTTLIGSVCGVVAPTSGDIRIFGHDYRSRSARHLVGLAEQDINLDRFLSIRQMLIFHAGYHGASRRAARTRADELLELFGLGHKGGARAYELSGGMQRRLLLARALMHRPRLLILDEPTAGVDVELRTEIWRLLKGLNAAGTTILLTTHYLEEAETLCDEVALIRGGTILANGSAASLRSDYSASNLTEVYERVIVGGDAA